MRIGGRIERLVVYLLSLVFALVGIILIFCSFHIVTETISSATLATGTTLLSVGIIGFIFQYFFQERFMIDIEELLKSEVIRGEVITSGQDYYHRATELVTKNAKTIRIANFYPSPRGATGLKDVDKDWLETLEKIIKNKKEPIDVFTRLVLVNKKRWEWVKKEMINKFEGCLNYNLYYYNSEPDELPIQIMVIIEEKQTSGDREEKKNVIIVNYEKGTGEFKTGLRFTDPKICDFFIEYYDHLLRPSSKNLVVRGEKTRSSFDVLEKKYGRNE